MLDEACGRELICQISKRLYDKGMLASCDGNISLRIDKNRVLITPSGVAKAFLRPNEMCVVDLEGNLLSGKKASSELKMHLAVYQNNDLAKAVVHAHPPRAIAWSIAKPEMKFLPNDSMSEVILALGKIPIVPFALPGSAEMGTKLLPFIDDSRAMILARHGALTWGEDIEEAYRGMERLENSVEILMYAEALGGAVSLDKKVVDELYKLREKIGPKSL